MAKLATYSIVAMLCLVSMVFMCSANMSDQDREYMLQLVNGHRAENSLGPLQLDARLNHAAEEHSYDMYQHNT